jgi:hypothetical protein
MTDASYAEHMRLLGEVWKRCDEGEQAELCRLSKHSKLPEWCIPKMKAVFGGTSYTLWPEGGPQAGRVVGLPNHFWDFLRTKCP